jgi:hypothetical protein
VFWIAFSIPPGSLRITREIPCSIIQGYQKLSWLKVVMDIQIIVEAFVKICQTVLPLVLPFIFSHTLQ